MQEQLPRTSATERAMDGLEACLRGQVPRVAADRLAPASIELITETLCTIITIAAGTPLLQALV